MIMKAYSNFLKKMPAIFRAVILVFATHANGAGLLIADGGFGGVLEIKECLQLMPMARGC